KNPRELASRGGRNAVEHNYAPEIEPRSDVRNVFRRARAQLLDEQSFDIFGANAARCQFVAIPRLGQVWLALQPHRRMFDGVFEGQVLERVQGVVVNENTDGPLR